jgi:uncharacterized membrane protein required for colicin V production
MNVLDWIIITWLVISFLSGAKLGLVYRVGHLVGLVVGIWLAFTYGGRIIEFFGGGVGTTITVMLALISGVSALGGILAKFLDKTFGILSWIPFFKAANSILGGILSVLINILVLSILFGLSIHLFTEVNGSEQYVLMIEQSLFYPYFLPISEVITPMIPWSHQL